MPAIDHLVYAVPDLDAGVAEVADLTGAEAVAGGSHPGAGTRNALLSFDDSTYFEIISTDPDQPEPERPRPFGVDPSRASRLASFAIHPTGEETIETVAERMRALDLPVGPVEAMGRQRPDGIELRWRLTLNRPANQSVKPSPDSGVVPFVIDWGVTETPAKSSPAMGRLAELRISHPDPGTVQALNSIGITVSGGEVVVAIGDPGLTAAVDCVDGRRVQLG